MSKRHALVLGFLAAALLSFSLPARANMANPVQAGDPIGEPGGDLRSVYIERETLTIDLRPLRTVTTHGDEKPALVVEAVYRVNNRGATVTTDLVFVANALSTPERSGVWRDEKPVRFREARAGAMTLPVVEVDGAVHDDMAEHDTLRTERIEAYGYRVIRFRNEEVLHDLSAVPERIEQAAAQHE